MIIKKVAIILLSAILALSFCACKRGSFDSVEESTWYQDVEALGIFNVESSVVCENEKFLLYWDKENSNIILKDKNTGATWSTTPLDEETGLPVSDENKIYSPVDIEYIFRSAFKTVSVTGKAGAIIEGGVTSKIIDNGIELTYLFKQVQISIPIQFVLKDEGLEVSVDLEKIGENSDASNYRVFNISLTPYFSSVKNEKNNYLVIPSGSGALMYADERGSGLARSFSGKVYGEDITRDKIESVNEIQPIRMPTFGVKNSGNNLVCIITDGAELSTIYANAGDADVGYSNVYAEFNVRGSNTSTINYGGSTGNKQSEYYSAQRITDDRISVMYIPTASEKEAYMDVADEYRNYLKQNFELDDKCEDDLVSIDFYGGIQTKKHIFGLPYNSLSVLTKYDDVEKIISDITQNSNVNDLNFRLLGFGKYGINNGKLIGNINLSPKFGNFEKIISFAKKTSFDMFVDYDILFYSKSGSGYSRNSDAALTANGYPAQCFKYSPATGTIRDKVASSSIISRDKLRNIVKDLEDITKENGINGISLSTLSNTAYSDYTEQKYVNSHRIQEDVISVLSNLKKGSYKIATDNANDYAACISDRIFNAPIISANNNSFDLDIPLYGILFKGYIPISGASINISDSSIDSLLRTIEFGGSLQFSLINNYSSEYASYLEDSIQYMKYDNVKESINVMISQTKDFLSNVSGKNITDYIIVNKSVRKTVFENGTVVYVNHDEEAVICDDIELKPKSFKVVS